MGKPFVSFVVVVDSEEELARFVAYHSQLFGLSSAEWIFTSRVPAHRTAAPKNFGKLRNVSFHAVGEGATLADCYNLGLEALRGQFASFTLATAFYGYETIEKVEYVAETQHAVQLMSFDQQAYQGKAPAPRPRPEFKARARRKLKGNPWAKTRIVDYDEVQRFRLHLLSHFVKVSLIRGWRFAAACEPETPQLFLMRVMAHAGGCTYVTDGRVDYPAGLMGPIDDRPGCDDPAYYLPSLREDYLPILREVADESGMVPRWLGRFAYYQLYPKFYANMDERDHELVFGDDLEEFLRLAAEVLHYIDERDIFAPEGKAQFNPPFALRNAFHCLKLGSDGTGIERHFELADGALTFHQEGAVHDVSRYLELTVRRMDTSRDDFVVDALFFSDMVRTLHPGSLYAEVNGVRVELNPLPTYSLRKVFATSISRRDVLELRVPLSSLRGTDTAIQFFLELDGERVPLSLRFSRPASRLHSRLETAFWLVEPELVVHRTGTTLHVDVFDSAWRSEWEARYRADALPLLEKASTDQMDYVREFTELRDAYFTELPKLNERRIWVYFDKLFKGSDNGEYAFRYAMDKHPDDGIEHYYIMNADAPAFAGLQKEYGDHVVAFDTLRCRLLALLAENIMATHQEVTSPLGFDSTLRPFVKDLFTANVVFIDHGVLATQIADYRNKLYDNTAFWPVVSEYEAENIRKPIYGYFDDAIVLTGMARFDGLVNRAKRQILITPTWRRSVVGAGHRNAQRDYSEHFKRSEYYRVYNGLINDPKLLACAKDHGYSIVYLLHPLMSTQRDDFQGNEVVTIVAADGFTNYEDYLNESSLMVTDASGVLYDFGYMRKPVVFYQPTSVPMRFKEGILKYETMGFGPVAHEHDQVVETLCEFMRTDCAMPEEYLRRANDFFPFDDRDNCKRIYEAVLAWTDERRKKGSRA